jgi:hypothetical protein
MGAFKSAVVEAGTAAPASAGGGKYKVKIISAGWGSSGYYSPEVLAESAPKAFPAGTHVYFDHPSESDRWDRPERSVKDLVGTLVSAPTVEGADVFSEFQPFPSYAPVIEQMKDNVGMSIRVLDATMEWGEVDGVEGPIITSLLPNQMNSVDIVTHAGRGGAIISAMESATLSDVDKPYLHSLGFQLPSAKNAVPVSESLPVIKKESHMPELTEAQVKTFDALAGAVPLLVSELTSQREAREAAIAAADKAKEVNPFDLATSLAEALTASELPAKGQAEALADIKRGMDVAEAIARWKGVFAAESAKSTTPIGGVLEGAGSGGGSAASVTSLQESLARLGDRSKGVHA